MDNQILSFLEMTALSDLAPLINDKRAAWLWSADGSRILWANAAGAAFFSAHKASDLAALKTLERSPARPHIARIAASGQTDRFSIDRLRFYKGLRVMLLTCQCKRLTLDNGDDAALIVCGDNGLALTKDPVASFAAMLAGTGQTVFVLDQDQVASTAGALSGVPENPELLEDQPALFGPLDLEGTFHDGVLLRSDSGHRIIVLSDDPLEEDLESAQDAADEAGASMWVRADDEDAGERATAAPEGFAPEIPAPDVSVPDVPVSEHIDLDPAGVETGHDVPDTESLDEDAVASPVSSAPVEDDAPPSIEITASDDPAPADTSADTVDEQAPGPEAADLNTPLTIADQTAAGRAADSTKGTEAEPPVDTSDEAAAADPQAEDTPEEPGADATTEDTDSKAQDETHTSDGFVFQPRRRPVRFAWKMDIDQRFTFLSDEFSDVLGPEATDIVGQSWAEVSERFDLDPRGTIARALDRRDTWSGKTVNWPVTGADLRVPVDMAALPAFDRDRLFEGYRGFGVCRTADAVQDTRAVPLSPALAAFDEDFATSRREADPEDEDKQETVEEDTTAAEPVASSEPETPLVDSADSDSAPEDDDALALNEKDIVEDEAAAAAAQSLDAALEAEDAAPEADTAPEGPASPSPDEGKDTSAAAEAQESVDDLKPAPPATFAGKTFIGSSAAALVGSLAKFTGRPAPKAETPAAPESSGSAPETTGTKTPDPASSDLPAEPDDDAAQANSSTDPEPADAEDQGSEAPGAMLDQKMADADLPAADAGDRGDVSAPAAEDAPVSAPSEDAAAEGDQTALPAEPQDDASAARPDTNPVQPDESAVTAAAEPDAEPKDAPAETVKTETEPTGISGPAPLAPAEIESAVKSLAKTYRTDKKEPRTPTSLLSGDTPQSVEPEPTPRDFFEDPADEPDFDGTADDLLAAAPDAEAPDLEDASADDTAAPEDNPEFEDTQKTDDAAADADEREFFEETAAFEGEEQTAQEEDSAAPDKQAADDRPEDDDRPVTGKVIPLATAVPRVVPVDTSSLSRPERQAFRKIAEALGARLEGDLADWDAPDPEETKTVDDLAAELPPEVPEAGPIDPSLLDRLPIGIAIVHEREVLYGNKALLKLLGYTSQAALREAGGLEALFIDETEDLPDADGMMDGEVDEPMKVRLADGGVRSVDAHMHSVPWNGGRGLMVSITERPSKPQSLEASAPASPNFFAEVRGELESARNQIAEMDTILETATDGVLVLDDKSIIVKANGSAEALFGAGRADMIGAPFTDFLAPESHRAAADYLDGLSRNGVASILNDGREVLGKIPAGGLIPLFMTMGRISATKEDPKYCVVLRDITQWKTAEEELTHAKRQAENASSAKSDFLAKISHEIRTPLNAIIGFSEVMMEERFGAIGNDRYKDYLKDIRTSGSHIMSLINDLLDLSKIEAGKLDLKFAAVSANEIINECVALMQPQANRDRVIIRASLPESVPNVVADPRSLRQIVLNLLSNGIKYNKSGGQVILSTTLETSGEVVMRVRDTGTGMTAKQLAAALEPFRQLHTASRSGGTGLGLPLTKALVEANRASFHIDSTPDQGTLVEITFPTQRVLSE
ncbi:PAS domain S-box protein [Roseibium denhamense]|uniref:histidine kinase n=1 Tax=Roseibium denhamense TaxID=76305 RepID=A0ABY1P1K5_9HYPH|nr:ATP-binding protein [Roseibium denhamense]MTI07606.1 PAS domain S-box protein [Roseibium denhamense]SMP24094.1 PAS domain S-box-containing protein [Roseibium denhamense]